jgi:hypothetical protein
MNLKRIILNKAVNRRFAEQENQGVRGKTGPAIIVDYVSIPSLCFSLRTRLEALSHPLASMMRFMDAYLLSAAVGCGFVLKAPTVGALNCRF